MTSSQPSCGTPLQPGGYCISIQKVRLFPCMKRSSLIFQLRNISGSSGSSCSSGSEAPSSGSMDASFKDSRAEAATSLKEIAGRIFLDGYTRRLIIHSLCGEARRHGGAQLALHTVFGDLDVDWVLDLGTGKIDLKKLEQDRTALDDLVERWSRALTVMVKVFHITWSDLQDQKLGILAVRTAPVSAPPLGTGLAARAYPMSEGSGASDWLSTDDASASSSTRRLSVKSVMTAYSLWGTGIADADQDEEAQFAGFAQASVLKMLAFADSIAGVERAPDNLLRTLDAYASVSDSAPLLLQMFSGFCKDAISAKIESTSRLLSDAVRAMMNDVKASIVAHISASPGAQSGCDVLETVRCAMDDITLLFNNYRSLNIFLQQDDECMFYFEGFSTLSNLIVELISCLEDSIEEKSRTYSGHALRYMFLLNNSHYVLERVEAMDLFSKRDRMNEPAKFMKEPTDLASSVSVREQKIESYIKSYLDSSWLRVTSCLSVLRKDKGCWPYSTGSGRCSSLVQFNSQFEITYATQKLWKVPNPQLRKRLRESITNKVIQEYTSHLQSYPGSKISGIHTPEEMKQLLAELFEG